MNYGPYTTSYISPDGNVETIYTYQGTFSNGVSFVAGNPSSGEFTASVNRDAVAFSWGTNNHSPIVSMDYIANTIFILRTGTQSSAVFLLK